jgi:hypothetical protein
MIKVVKKSGKPFKSQKKIATVKGIINHPILNVPAFIFYEDDSYVECSICEVETMTREQLLPYVSYLIDDSLSALDISEVSEYNPDHCTLVGFQCGFEPMVVAVRSYLSEKRPDKNEAVELAVDYLEEIGWFSWNGNREPDYVL